MRQSALVVLVVVLGGAPRGPLSAQGSGGPFDGRLLPVGADTFVGVFSMGGASRPARNAHTQVALVERAPGDTALRRVMQWYGGARQDSLECTDTLWLSSPSLAPLAYRAVGPRDDDSLAWSGGRVRGYTTDRTSRARRMVDVEAGADVYPFTALELLVRAAPLGPKYRSRVQLFDSRFGTDRVDLRVAGDARTPGGADYWIVEAEYANIPQRFYVEKATRRLAGWRLTVTKGVYVETMAAWSARAPDGPP